MLHLLHQYLARINTVRFHKLDGMAVRHRSRVLALYQVAMELGLFGRIMLLLLHIVPVIEMVNSE